MEKGCCIHFEKKKKKERTDSIIFSEQFHKPRHRALITAGLVITIDAL